MSSLSQSAIKPENNETRRRNQRVSPRNQSRSKHFFPRTEIPHIDPHRTVIQDRLTTILHRSHQCNDFFAGAAGSTQKCVSPHFYQPHLYTGQRRRVEITSILTTISSLCRQDSLQQHSPVDGLFGFYVGRLLSGLVFRVQQHPRHIRRSCLLTSFSVANGSLGEFGWRKGTFPFVVQAFVNSQFHYVLKSFVIFWIYFFQRNSLFLFTFKGFV